MKVLLIALCASSLLAVTAPAFADDCYDVATLKKEGNAAFGKEHYDEALGYYGRAYACDKDTSLLFNMAKAELLIRQYVAGLDLMRRFERESRNLPPEVRTSVASTLAELSSHVGTISVHGPAGSRVAVDDREIGLAPIENVEVAAGTVSVRVVAPGHDAVDRRVQLGGGKHELVEVSFLSPDGPAEKPHPASSEGGHAIHPLVWIGAGTLGAGLIVGATAGALSLSKVSSLKKLCPQNQCQTNIDADRSSANTLANVSNVGFAFVALGAVLGGVGIGLTVANRDDSPRVSISPTGLALDGSF